MSQRPWPCHCVGFQLSSKGRATNMVCRNLYQDYLWEMGMTQILTDHEPLFTNFSCKTLCRLVNYDNFFRPWGLHLVGWIELGRSRPFRPIRDLRMQWSQAFSLMCEVAFIPLQHWFVEWIGVTNSIDGYLYTMDGLGLGLGFGALQLWLIPVGNPRSLWRRRRKNLVAMALGPSALDPHARSDGRTENQVRPLECSRGLLARAHGSASWSQGEIG